MDVTLVFIRHSKSCANHVRHVAGTEDRTDPLVAASQHIRDPALSAVGEQMAREYGPALQAKLVAHAASREVALIASSPLRRAKQTARLLFGTDRPHTFTFFGEKGHIPENTAEGADYTTPNWPAFLRTVHARLLIDPAGRRTVITVGHGSFLRSTVWPAIANTPFKGRVHNLDAFVVRGTFNCDGVFTPDRKSATYIPYTGRVKPHAADACALPTKIASDSRMTRYTRKAQRGGYVGMPLAYFKDGAQMQGTTAEPTGVGLGSSTGSWAREPIQQSGGSVKRGARTKRSRSLTRAKHSRSLTRAKHFKHQQGGFSPSIMGSFVTNGMRLVPAVAYVGYKMLKNQKRTRRAARRGRQTRRN